MSKPGNGVSRKGRFGSTVLASGLFDLLWIDIMCSSAMKRHRVVTLQYRAKSCTYRADWRRGRHANLRTSISRGSQGPERVLNGAGKVGLLKRLLHHDRAPPERLNPRRVAADEHVRDGAGPEYCLDG